MKCTKFKYSLLFIVLMIIGFTSACKESSGDYNPKLYYTIEGVVKNINDDTLQDVRVEVTDYAMDNNASKPTDIFATLTDEDGAFSLEVIAYDRVESVSLKFSRDGYTTNYLTTGVMQDQTVEITSVLQTMSSFRSITATEDNTVTGSGGASVTISANTLVNAAGSIVSTARVSVTAIDTTANIDLLPGDQYGMENGSLKIFTTYGMIEIAAKDGEGDPLYLASGATATISIPLGEIAGTNPPATASMWYYNEESAEWLPQGSLTLNGTGTAYEGTVSHFSIFNAGITRDATYLKARVVDQAGDPIYGTEVSIFTDLFSDDGIWQASYTSGPEGYVPSILDTGLSGIVPDSMDGYLPLPANAELNVRLKYIKPDAADPPVLNEDLFICRSGQPAPTEGVEDTRQLCEMPFVSGDAGASELYTGEPVVFELEKNAFVTGTVKYENGDPAANLWLYFLDPEDNNSTIKLGHIDNDGNIENVTGSFPWFNYTGEDLPLPAETSGIMLVSTGSPTSGVGVASWFVNTSGVLDFYPDYSGGDNIAKIYTSGMKGETDNFEITLSGGGDTGPVDTSTPMSYVSGIATLGDGVLAPAGSWVVFSGSYASTPIVVRAQVASDGTFPDQAGPFAVESIGGEYYVPLPAETDFWVTIQDVVTDPVNPDILFTYEYTSAAEDATDNIIISAKAKVIGTINDENNAPLEDVMVSFVETEPEEDPDNEGEYLDPDTVTVYTDASGNFGSEASPVSLKFDTQYTVTVSYYQTVGNQKLPTDDIWVFYYTSKTDGTLDSIIYPPQPPALTGTIQYSDGSGPGNYAYFTITPVGGTTQTNILAAADGTSFNEVDPTTYQPIRTDGIVESLLPNTQYQITRYMQTTVIYTFTTLGNGETLTIHVDLGVAP